MCFKIDKYAANLKHFPLICRYRQITPLTFDPNVDEDLQMEPVLIKDMPSTSKQVWAAKQSCEQF